MDILKSLNDALSYIENNLADTIDIQKAARMAGSSAEGFKRLFSFLAGITLHDYIRRRRLTLAAQDIQNGKKVIDTAVKYGFNSADPFSRAFIKQHGIVPSQARCPQTRLTIYPPVSFHILIKGVRKMNFRIVETECVRLSGLSCNFSGDAANRFEQEHIMWADHHDAIQNKVSPVIPGVWFGIWNKGRYSIAKRADAIQNKALEHIIIPAENTLFLRLKKAALLVTSCQS